MSAAPLPIFSTLRPYARHALLVAVSIGFSLCFACAAPLVAFAALGALTMPRNEALALVAVIWLANQVVGYGFLDYPTTDSSLAWGAVLGVAAICATLAAQTAVQRYSGNELSTHAVPLAVAFAVYQLVMLVAALLIGGMEGMAPKIVAWAALVDTAAFAGLCMGNRLLATVAPASALKTASGRFA